MEELKKSIFEELDDITEEDEVMQEDKKIKKECKTNLEEGTSNFPTRSEFPLLVFYTYDEFYNKMKYDSDYPEEGQFEHERENGDFYVDWDAYEKAKDAFEQDYWDKNDICVLDEDDQERLESKLDDFNDETKNIANNLYDVDNDDDYYALKDIELNIKSGYYEAAYIDVDGEEQFNYMSEDVAKAQRERFNKFLEELKKEFGLTKLGVAWGPASNGETGFKIMDESMKSEVTTWWKDVEDANKEMQWGFNIDNGNGEDVEAMHAAMFDMLDALKEKGASELFKKGKKIYNKYALSKFTESYDEDLYDKVIDVLDDYGILYGDVVDYGDKINLVGIDEEDWEDAKAAIEQELHLTVLVPDSDHEEFDDELIVLNEAKKKKPHEIVATGYDLAKSTAMLNHALGSDCCEDYDDLDEYDTDSYYNEEDVCVYQFPSSMSEKDIKGAKKYGLTYLGIVNDLGSQPGDYLVKGKYGDLKKYCDEYLGYVMHPYYLCKEEECDLEDILEACEENLEESCSDKELVDKLVAFGTCDSEEEAKERVAKMSQEMKDEMCNSLKKQAQDHLLNDSLKESSEELKNALEMNIAWCKSVLNNPKGRQAMDAKANYGKAYIKKVKDDLARFEKRLSELSDPLKEDKEVARVEYCVMDKDNNNIECFDNTDDAIAFAKDNEGIRVLEVQYGPKDEHGDEPELSAEEVWSIRESLKEEKEESEVVYVVTELGNDMGTFDSESEAIKFAKEHNHQQVEKRFKDDLDGDYDVVWSNEKFESLKEALRRYKIEYWVDEEARDQGLGDIAIETFDDLEDAKEYADKLFSDVASVEVLDTQDNDNVVYGRYPEDESMNESKETNERKRLKYLLDKEECCSLDKGERFELQNLIQKYGYPEDESLKEERNPKFEFKKKDGSRDNGFEYKEKEWTIKADELSESITILVKKNDLWEEFASIDNCPTKDMSEEDINNNYKELVEKVLNEKAYGLFLKVRDRDNKIIKDEKEPLMTGTRQECVDKKKQLEDTSAEDSYHNKNIYTIKEL